MNLETLVLVRNTIHCLSDRVETVKLKTGQAKWTELHLRTNFKFVSNDFVN